MSLKQKMATKKARLKMKMYLMKIRILRKMGKAGLWFLALSLVKVVAGCATPASRAQSQVFDRCLITVNIGAGGDVSPGDEQPQYGDILTQNMVVENSGSESTEQGYTMTPNVPISVPVGLGGGESLGVFGPLLDRIWPRATTEAGTPPAACTGADCSL